MPEIDRVLENIQKYYNNEKRRSNLEWLVMAC